MKEIEILIRGHIVYVTCGKESAIMTRKRDEDGLLKIVFSIPLKAKYADVINQSGIAEVEKISYDECSITFKPLPFYETHVMSELITNIFERYEASLILNC